MLHIYMWREHHGAHQTLWKKGERGGWDYYGGDDLVQSTQVWNYPLLFLINGNSKIN
jgi:hypothetical protein